KTDASVVAGAYVLVNAEFLTHDPLARLDRLAHQRPHAALLVQHAFRRGDDDLGSGLLCRERLAQRVAHRRDVVGVVDLPYPPRADAVHSIDDAVVRLAVRIVRARGRNVLPPPPSPR